MVPAPSSSTAPVPPPAYHRARARRGSALHLDALTLVTRLHLLARCRFAVGLAQRQHCRALLPVHWGRPSSLAGIERASCEGCVAAKRISGRLLKRSKISGMTGKTNAPAGWGRGVKG